MDCPSCNTSPPGNFPFCPNCGAKAQALAKPEPEDPIRAALRKALGQQYEIQRLLGKGGMGAVYLATEAALEREVAIKVLPPDRGATQDSRDRFRREARTAAKLSHPNIVPLYTFGDVDGTLYFVMGYVRGESLAARLKREGRLPVEDARRILIEIAEALDYAHKLGVIHRDIKPDNVLLEEGTGRALLTDFGVAKALGAGQTMTEVGSVLGTPQYMSPEQAQGKAGIDHRSDLYSLGVMGYAMLAGRLPFEGPTAGDIMAQHITRDAPALKSIAPDVPGEIATALTRCLAKDPNQRWPEARSFKDAISLKVDDEIPEEMAELSRDIQVAGLGLYLSALVVLYLNTLLPDPEGVEAPWEIVFFGSGLAILVCAYQLWSRRREGRSWSEIVGFAFGKPGWWAGWYPRRLRRRGDVWDRLPGDLRRTRAAFWGAFMLWALFMPALFIYLSAENGYRKTGLKSPAQKFFAQVPRAALRLGPLGALTFLGLGGVAFYSAHRWGRSPDVAKVNRRLTNAMFLRDTGRRSFWAKPEIASLLLPAGEDGARGRAAPTSARDLSFAISAAVSSLAGGSSIPGARAREVALDLARTLEGLDQEIASMAGALDAAEIDRLVAKIAGLGAPSKAEGEAKGQMRDLFQKQLDLLRGLAERVEQLKASRARRLELLRTLWCEAIELRESGTDASRASRATSRILELCSEIGQHADSSSPTRPVDPGLADSPTMERTEPAAKTEGGRI